MVEYGGYGDVAVVGRLRIVGIWFWGISVGLPGGRSIENWSGRCLRGHFIWAVAGSCDLYLQGLADSWGSLLAIVCLIAGYLVGTSVYLAQEEHRDLPAVTRSRGETGDGHTAVLYFTHGEPPAYSPLPWIETFHELDGDGVSFIPWPFRPVFLNNLRREYLVVGGSAHNKVHQIMLQSLIQNLPLAKDQGVRFYQAFLDNPPRPDEMAIAAINDGASKLVVLPVFLTDSSHTQAGQEMIDAVGFEKYGIDVCYAKPLWDTEALQQMFVERANDNLGGVARDQVGIVLVGHGQPDDWDAIYPTQTEQENLFRTQVRQRLVEAGYLADHISLGWMEFKEPDIQQAVRELVAKGVKRLLIFSASISARFDPQRYPGARGGRSCRYAWGCKGHQPWRLGQPPPGH